MAAKISLSQPNPISNPNSAEFVTACENLSLCALGVLAWMHYSTTYFPDESIGMDVLDPNVEPGVEQAVNELADAGYIHIDGVL